MPVQNTNIASGPSTISRASFKLYREKPQALIPKQILLVDELEIDVLFEYSTEAGVKKMSIAASSSFIF
jgi:hypothetical protein